MDKTIELLLTPFFFCLAGFLIGFGFVYDDFTPFTRVMLIAVGLACMGFAMDDYMKDKWRGENE